nr:hypothetical protein [Tanacetum cinerariifolium]
MVDAAQNTNNTNIMSIIQQEKLTGPNFTNWLNRNCLKQLKHSTLANSRMDKKKPQGEKGKDKGKNNLAFASKAKISPPPKRDNLAKDPIYYHCKEVGHWRRNNPSYHAELKKRKNASVASTLGLRESRKLKHEALSLYIENRMCAAVEAIRSFDVIIPSGLVITVTRGVVSISRL